MWFCFISLWSTTEACSFTRFVFYFNVLANSLIWAFPLRSHSIYLMSNDFMAHTDNNDKFKRKKNTWIYILWHRISNNFVLLTITKYQHNTHNDDDNNMTVTTNRYRAWFGDVVPSIHDTGSISFKLKLATYYSVFYELLIQQTYCHSWLTLQYAASLNSKDMMPVSGMVGIFKLCPE